MTDPVNKLANDPYRLAATEGLRRIPGNFLSVTFGSSSNSPVGSTM